MVRCTAAVPPELGDPANAILGERQGRDWRLGRAAGRGSGSSVVSVMDGGGVGWSRRICESARELVMIEDDDVMRGALRLLLKLLFKR